MVKVFRFYWCKAVFTSDKFFEESNDQIEATKKA